MIDLDGKSQTQRGASESTAAVIYLSGPRRGHTQKVSESTLRITLLPDGGASLMRPADPQDREVPLGSLHRSGTSYELVVADGHSAWVNGVAVRARLLLTGDLVEVEQGPVFRFRIYPAGGRIHKTLAEVFADCVDCARRDGRPILLKMPGLLAGMVRDLATETTLWFRGAVIMALAALAVLVVVQVRQMQALEAVLGREQAKVQVLAEALRKGARDRLTHEDLAAVRAEIEQGLVQTEQRVAALESRSAALQRIIATFSDSVVFIQGAYGFVHEATGRPLRVVPGSDGKPMRRADGEMLVTLTGDGPPVEMGFTGTAFIVPAQGLLLTNRHVALPWESTEAGEAAKAIGLKPAILRMIGFVPGEVEPFDVKLALASDEFDLAVLRCQDVTRLRTPLKLAASAPLAGDEVVVLGYPTGVRALLARAGERFVAALSGRPDLDLLGVTRELAKAGLVKPLASRGIVGQVTNEMVVYDAQTTQGGSGGPVVNLNGEVIAVNTAILREFGGSNLGIPIGHAVKLIDRASAGK